MKSRIAKLIKVEKLSSSKFADSIGVQRSSISHILSGRNKPSLDFIQKILSIYKNISSDWLLFGKGGMYKEGMSEKDSINHIESLFKENKDNTDDFDDEEDFEEEIEEKIIPQKRQTAFTHKEKIQEAMLAPEITQKKVERIVLFFTDKTFKEYMIIE